MTSCRDEEDPQEERIATIEGTWMLRKACVNYHMRLLNTNVKLKKIDVNTLNEIFGGTTFAFNADGALQVGDNYTCTYEINKAATELTMYIEDKAFTCDITKLDTTTLELYMSGKKVVDYILKYTDVDLSGLESLEKTSCTLTFTH